MASEFKYLKFGLVPLSLDHMGKTTAEQVFKSFLSSYDDFQLIDDSQAHAEVFAMAKRYIGSDFRNWLIVNFRNGGGARKELARKIVGFINGRIAGRMVISQIKIDFNRIQNLSIKGEPIGTSIIYDQYDTARNKWLVEDVDFSAIEDRHVFDFFALIGPELAAKFCLSMDGVFYDHKRD
uniref:Uncharacterized protein n=1 Tax=Pantoea phage Survivor TaxID=3232176 RepID=A0AAU8L0G2_9CAUD